MGGLGLNVVHACRLFFFFKEEEEEEEMSTRHAYQWSNGFEVLDVLPRGPLKLNFGRAS